MRINLRKDFFSEKEFVLLENKSMRATCFRYSTGVEAVKVENSKGYFIILPFQGQQVWRAGFLGHELTMKTKFEEPVPTLEYLKTYGSFLLHCGISSFGAADSSHPQHGEIPNALYRKAYIECGDDYIAVGGGNLDYDISYTRNYTFTPECRLYENDTVLKLHVKLENRRQTPMEYMYLCHINFRPINGAQLMSRTGDEDSCGMVLPATAEHLGYQHAKRNGQIKVLSGNETLEFDMEAGWLDAARVEKLIAAKGLV